MVMPPACSVRVKLNELPTRTWPFVNIAGDLHPDHDTLANFRKTYLAEIKELFVQILLLVQAADILKLGNISNECHMNSHLNFQFIYAPMLSLTNPLR
jgi:hypothetical protein